MATSHTSSSSQQDVSHTSGGPDSTRPHPDINPPRVQWRSSSTAPIPILDTDWTKYTHINGSVYFYNHKLRVITEDDVESDKQARQEVVKTWAEVEQVLLADDLIRWIPADSQMVVRLGGMSNGDHVVFFMSHATQTHIVVTDDEVRVEFGTSRFWTHVEEYPMHLARFPLGACPEFLSALAYGASEAIMENRQNKFPFTDAQIERLLRIYEDLYDTTRTNPSMLPILIWHIARTLRRIESARKWFRVPHPSIPGLCGFKLLYTRHEPDRGLISRTAEWLLIIMLMRSYTMYWRRLAEVREGVTIDLLAFRAMLQEFLTEWSNSNLIATVVVGANVTFLSLPNINSIQRTAALTSTIFAVLSIIIGLWHVWNHRTKVNADIIEACKFMNHTRHFDDRTDDSTDLIIMGSFLAVPIASLLWSIACFTIAIGAYCIQGTDKAGSLLLPSVLGIALSVGGSTVLVMSRLGKEGTLGASGSQIGMSRQW